MDRMKRKVNRRTLQRLAVFCRTFMRCPGAGRHEQAPELFWPLAKEKRRGYLKMDEEANHEQEFVCREPVAKSNG